MIYALIITIYMQGDDYRSPVAVSQSSTVGFTSEQACKNAGRVASAGAGAVDVVGRENFVVYQCAPLSV